MVNARRLERRDREVLRVRVPSLVLYGILAGMTYRKYTKEMLQEAVDNSVSVAGVLRYLNLAQAGGTHSHISKMISNFEISTDHFTGQSWNRGYIANNRKTAEEILVIRPAGSIREARSRLLRAMLDSGIDYVCECGQQPSWRGKILTLDIDHVNGDWLDNRLENLRFLCPNCHSQQASSNRPHKNKTS